MNNTKKQIFDSAISLFAERGYTKTTLDDIAVKANVAKGTLYYYFDSKESLFKFLVDEGMNIIYSHIQEEVKDIKSPLEKLEKIMQIQCQIIKNYNKFILIVLSQIWGSEDRHVNFRSYVYSYIEKVKHVIDQAIDENEIPKCDSNVIASACFGMLSSSMIYKMMDEENFDLEAMCDSMLSLILNGIK